MGKTIALIVLCLWLACFKQSEASNTRFVVKHFDLCNKTQGLITFQGNITNENGGQFLTAHFFSPIPWDNNFRGECLIECKVGNGFVELFTIREKNACKALNTYLGEFWYDIERAAQVPMGVCPIREGRYHVNHVKLEFEKISLQTFPFGTLRFTLKGIDNKHPQVGMLCLAIEVENFPEVVG